MKKLLLILILILTIFALSSCDITDLSATEGEMSTSFEDNSTEVETYADGSHSSCEYCGQLEGYNRWFIAKITENLMVMPIGNNCFEARSAMDAGIYLSYKEIDGDTNAKLKYGDVIKVEYNGMIMETFPVQISADKVTIIGYEDPSINNALYAYNVTNGTLIVKSGKNQVRPLKGFVYSSSEEVEADGAGISFYLDAIFDGNITDEDMPVLYLDGELDIDLSKNSTLTVNYIIPDTKATTSCKLRQLSELDIGQYYVVLEIVTKNGNSSFCYEYIFKLVVNQSIRDNIEYYIKKEDGYTKLVLPLSDIKLSTWSCEDYLYLIDVELLTRADDIFTGGHSSESYGIYLGFDKENYLCLCQETICDSDDEIGHSHSVEKIRITKEPCIIQP